MLFEATAFGFLLSQIWRDSFHLRSWRIFLTLSQGWSLSSLSHTVAEYIWLSGGIKDRHFSRYYAFLDAVFWPLRESLWCAFYRWLEVFLPSGDLFILVDDTTRKKSGRKIQGISNYHNQAGSARQEYRVLRGLNFVYLSLRISWQGFSLTLPMGCDVYLKEDVAHKLGRTFHSRSALARRRLARIGSAMPTRNILLCCDGAYATKEMLRDLPEELTVVTRLLVSGAIHEPPCPVASILKRGRKPQKGAALPAPKYWPTHYKDWQAHPTEAGAMIRTAVVRWPKSYPGKNLRVVVVWRPTLAKSKHPRDKKRHIESFISTNVHHKPKQILAIYKERWAVEIDIRDAYASYGLGKDRCRKLSVIEAINNLRLMLAAARTCWFIQAYQHTQIDLKFMRPWYTHKTDPSQADITLALKEALELQGIKPIPRFFIPIPLIHQQPKESLERAA
ncbi:MAG: transposase [Bacteroidota bacterium]